MRSGSFGKNWPKSRASTPERKSANSLRFRHNRLSTPWCPCGKFPRMALYQHEFFTLNLNKVISVYQDPDDPTVTIQTDDQRKIEVAADSPEAAAELRMEFAAKWESAVGPLLRHGQHVFLTS